MALSKKEFFLENPDRSYHCFLNVVLQTLWRMPPIQESLLMITESIDTNEKHPEAPLVNSIKVRTQDITDFADAFWPGNPRRVRPNPGPNPG